MWRRMTDEEIAVQAEQKLKEMRSPRKRLFISLLFATVITVLYGLGVQGVFLPSGMFIVTPAVKFSAGKALVLWVMGFGIAWFGLLWAKPKEVHFGGMCGSCFETQVFPPDRRCACGGLVEPVDYFEWVESPTGESR